jgi:hypothetical protein
MLIWETIIYKDIDVGVLQATSQASMKAEDSWKVQHTFYMFWKCF